MNEKTDMEKFLALYKSFGIELEVEHFEGSTLSRQGKTLVKFLPYYTISIKSGCDFGGPVGPGSITMFNSDGKFLHQVVYGKEDEDV